MGKKNQNHLNQLQWYEVKSEHLTLMNRESLQPSNTLAQVQIDWDRPTPKKNQIPISFLEKMFPKNHRISKVVVWRSQTPAIHIQTPQIRRVTRDS